MDELFRAASLTGASSFGTNYAQPIFHTAGYTPDGEPYGTFDYEDTRVRDVTYEIADQSGAGLITFSSRQFKDGTFGPLSADDELLTIVIDGFSDGDGGISFQMDALSSLLRFAAVGSYYTTDNLASVWDVSGEKPDYVTIPLELDVLDGNADGRIGDGSPVLSSDNPLYNFGYHTFEGLVDWDDYLAVPVVEEGSAGDDALDGGSENDHLTGADGNDVLVGGAGDDWLDGGAGNDRVYGMDGNDRLIGGPGDDILEGGDGEDVIDGGDGVDVAEDSGNSAFATLYREFDGSIVVESFSWSGPAKKDRYFNIESLHFAGDNVTVDVTVLPVGTVGDDSYVGTEQDDIYFAGPGHDLVRGMGGNDRLSGEEGDDLIDGGEGQDELDGGAGLDTVEYAGCLDDYVISRAVSGDVTVAAVGTSEGQDVLTRVERLSFRGDGAVLDLTGDAKFGTESDDLLEGTLASDVIYGFTGADVLYGGGGDDRLFGGAQNDTLYGGSGNDVLNGGADFNWLHGGTGDDTYYYEGREFIFEDSDQGTDLVICSANYELGANVENLRLGRKLINGIPFDALS